MRPLLLAAALALTAACGPTRDADAPAGAAASAATTSRMGVHGMIVAGAADGPVFLSHIPMFHPPHDVQLVLEARIVGAPAGVPTSLSGRLYTLRPRAFSLDALRDGSLARVRGALYRGNFEAGGRLVASDVTFEVRRVVLDAELDAGTPAPPAPEYVVVGAPDAAVAVRVLAGATGADQVLAVRAAPGASLDASELARGVRFAPAGAPARPAAGDALTPPSGADGFVVERELSCLLGPHFTDACPDP